MPKTFRGGLAMSAAAGLVVLLAVVAEHHPYADDMAQPFRPAATQTAPGAPGGPDAVAEHFDGTPAVGTFVDADEDLTDHSCTGTVIESPQGNLIITAAHCAIQAGRSLFVPGYNRTKSAAEQPYGTWQVDRTWVDSRYYAANDRDGDGGTDYDVMFVRVKPDRAGRSAASVTGAHRLARTPDYENDEITLIGYPWSSKDPEDRAVRCTVPTTRLPGHDQLQVTCDGYASGVSGGPWLRNFDGTKGEVIGVIGGLQRGGPTDQISYSPFIGNAAFELFDRAIHDQS
ncbi:trypsin-like serine peptidase [Streptomyces sp. NPDC059443]|uniref:trypsin-like serine peptidase n=1 Tax=unclassified Streptomyces TaxID=2593676 RepID=UPI003685297F